MPYRPSWPNYETPQYSEANFLQGIDGTAIREYGNTIENAVKGAPNVLAPLKAALFKVGLFIETGVTTVFVNLEGFPEDWKTNVPAVTKFFRDHHRPSFMEYSEYPYATTADIKKGLKLRHAFGEMLDQMQ